MTDVLEETEEVEEKSGDDLLEEAYAKLSILEETLKHEIEQYFYDNGRWERAELPPPAESEVQAALQANPELQVETTSEEVTSEEETGFVLK